jgi:aspartate racemase
MRKTIGILGGMGPLATADLFEKIVRHTKAARDGDHVRVYIDSNSAIPDRTAAILAGGPDPVEEMASALRNLEKCGADCIIMPCNTAHYFLPRLRALTDTAILNMLEITGESCADRFPGKRAAVLATRGTLATGLYSQALERTEVDFIIPDEAEQDVLMHLIYDVVKASRPIEPERETWARLLEGLRKKGADYFILGCTELPIVAATLDAEGPFVDPTEELAKEAIRYCGYEVKE